VKSADIKGYRDLSQEEVNLVNFIKDAEVQVGKLWQLVAKNPDVDRRWLAIAKTHFQEGFTALVRAVTRPIDVF
jgi:hypothetical protein